MTRDTPRQWKRLLLVLGLAALAVTVFSSGLHERLRPEALGDLLTGSGPWGPLLFVALFAGLEAFGVPGILFIATAIALWPPWLAFLLNWCGAVGAGCVGYGFARGLGGDWVARRLPASLAGLDARIARRGLATVIFVRLVFFLAPPAHWALGLTRVRFGALLLGSILGLAPGIAALSFGGSALYAWLEDQSTWTWLLVIGVAVVLFAVWSRLSRSRIRLQSGAESGPREEPAMNRNSGTPLIVAAVILGASIVAGAVLVRDSLRATGEELASLRETVKEMPRAQPAAPARPAARRGPDPNRRYEMNVTGAPVKGPGSAKVTVVEFSDFQCPFCSRVNPTMARIHEEYPDDVRIVFKHLPLRIHPKAPAAHAAAEAAHSQGRFWEMHDAIFANQAGMSPERYREYAEQIGLDLERYEQDLKAADVQKRVLSDSAEAERLGVTGTPAFFVNGRYLSGAQPYESFKRLIDEELGQG